MPANTPILTDKDLDEVRNGRARRRGLRRRWASEAVILGGSGTIVPLNSELMEQLAREFSVAGWNKPREQYVKYLRQHEEGAITCLVAQVGEETAGYLKIVWSPDYEPLRSAGIPEIQDLNVLDRFRRQGVASRLMDSAEETVAQRSRLVGIGVGLHPGYNGAQRLYVLRGYVPDGLGVTYKDEYVSMDQVVNFDDDLVLHFTKELERR